MFRPGHQQPLHDGDRQQPDISPQPVMVREAIDASQKWFNDQGQNATIAAQAIISRRASQIHQFYNAQRMNRDLSGLTISRTHLDLGDISLTYEINNGQAILSVVVYPENVKPGKKPLGDIDLNFDGYFAWIHCEPNYPDLLGSGVTWTANTPGPYDVYLNEYLVLENVVIDQACSAILVMFGTTALRVPSLVDPPDADSEKNPLASRSNGGLVPGVIPPRKQVAINTGPDGATLPKHNDLFGYWLFDWTNILNQGSYIQDLDVRWAAQGFPSPNVVKGIQFADPQSSPLVSSGVNDFSVLLSPLPKVISEFEVIIQNVIYSEFYDRGEMKTAQSTWRKRNTEGIIANDKPLQFCSSSPGGGGDPRRSGLGIKVDLTPNLKPSERDDDLVTVSDPPTGGQEPQFGLSPAQIAANNAYQAEIVSISNIYYASITAQVTAAQAVVAAARNTYTNAVVAFTALVGANEVLTPGGTLLTTLLGAGYLMTNTTEINGFNVRDYALAHFPSQHAVPPLIDFNALTNAINALAASGQPYLDASNALNNLQNIPPPTIPPRPANAGKKLNTFVYRLFTVAGGQWTFGPWQNK